MNPRELAHFLGSVPPPGRILEPIGQLPLRDDLTPGALWTEFSSAVSRQAEGLTRVGVTLGGLDSSGILAAAVEERGADGVVAFSYRGGDDDPFVDEICGYLGVKCVALGLDEPMSRVEQGLVVGGEPFATMSAVFDLHVARAARSHGVDGLLSGFAGDDILGGEFELFAPMIREHPLVALPMMLGARLPRPQSSRARIWRWALAPTIRRAIPARVRLELVRKRLRRSMAWLSQEALDMIDPGLEELVEVTRTPTTPLEVYEGRATLPDYRVWAHGRAQLARESGVQHGDPCLDSRLVATLSSVPLSTLLLGGTFRGLFRAALQNRVPDRVRQRIGKASSEVIFAEHRARIHAQLRPLVTLAALSDAGFVRPRLFREAFDRGGPLDRGVWRTLSAEAYLRGGAAFRG